MKRLSLLMFAALFAIAMPVFAQAPKPYEIEDFIREQKFYNIKISPTGEYFAATVPFDRKTILVILRRSDTKIIAKMAIPGYRTHVADFWWVNNERVLISAAQKLGELERPRLTGELYAINVDGSRGEMLVGVRMQGDGSDTHIRTKKTDDVEAYLVDDLPDDDKFAIISVSPFFRDPYTKAERLNVYTGQRVPITQAPIRNAEFVTDHHGNVRFAIGKDSDNVDRVYYRAVDGKEWKLINDAGQSGLALIPLGFAQDDSLAYIRVEREKGPDAIETWNPATDERKEVFRDDNTDPDLLSVGDVPVGVEVMDGLPRKAYFDPDAPLSKLYRKLERAFAGEHVRITSATRDGKLVLVAVDSDRSPGFYYLFDTTTNKADLLLNSADWIDSARVATMAPVEFEARDGWTIHGYLTVPNGATAKNLPLIVYVHGGPFSVYDTWGYDRDVQMLAAHGYAVLQVNFRGSGNYGHAFMHAGRRQWGGKMQDDITDATRWAIDHGIANPERICIYGASYGAYASLMGAVREPSLYRCAAGYVGVYDLPTMYTDGDIHESGSGKSYLEDWMGSKDEVAKVSPNRLAAQIKVPVFLAAGGEDVRAPIQHTQMMERALKEVGIPVEAYYYPTEGHGFYNIDNERDYYGKLLTFFQRNLGGRAPVVTPPSK